MEENTPEITYRKFKEHWINFTNLGNIPDLPISKILVMNLKDMKNIFDEKEAAIEEVINKHAKIDEGGKWIGVEYDDTNEKGEITKKKRDLSKKYYYDWIDVNDRKEFNKELDAILDSKVKYKFKTVKSNKMVNILIPKEFKDKNGVASAQNVEKEMQLLGVLERKLSANFILLLLDTIIELVE